MSASQDLVAVDVHPDEVGDYRVTEAGWYALDDGGGVVLGPFDSLSLCERAMGEWWRMHRTDREVPR